MFFAIKIKQKWVVAGLIWAGLGLAARAQDVKVELGKTEIALNENFQVTLSSSSGQLNEYTFPEIPGFTKQGISSSSSMTVVNGSVSQTYKLIQNYRAGREGSFSVPPLTVKAGGKTYRTNAATVRVSAARQYSNPFDDFWAAEEEDPADFVTGREDAFFAVTTNKDEVFQGEGFNLTIAFYISNRNQAVLEFYQVGQQLTEILKKVKPANCWEENFGIEEITPSIANLGGKTYRQYKIYQATLYPLDDQPIKIPSAELKMLKYRMARTQSFFGTGSTRDFRTFYSKPKTVRVKSLPPHPLRDQVPVGNYKLVEKPGTSSRLNTGQSLNFLFEITGEGNISSISEPTLQKRPEFEFYPPAVRQQINRANGVVYGDKVFNYQLIPNEPGTYAVSDFLNLVFFNPKTAKYDTLRPQAKLFVQGESRANNAIRDNDQGGFYDAIDDESNGLVSGQRLDMLKIMGNLVLLGFIVATGAVVFYKRKK
jgi:BatD DUF11 like domain